MVEWLILVEGYEYRVESDKRHKAVRLAVKRHLAEVGSVFSLSVLAIMARSRKLSWKVYEKATGSSA